MAVGLLVSPPPTADGEIRGEVVFGIDRAAVPEDAFVQYLLNGRTLCGPLTQPPYEFRWHTAHLWDGPVGLQALVRDSDTSLLDRSEVARVRIANGGSHLAMPSPGLAWPDPYSVLPQPWNGVVSFELEGTRADEKVGKFNKVTFWVYVDGVLQRWSNGAEAPRVSVPENAPARTLDTGVRLDVDTTAYADGLHDLVVLCEASEPRAEIAPPGSRWGMIQTPVMIANHHTIAAVRPRWREVYLEPGETTALTPAIVRADGRATAADAVDESTSDDETVASIDPTGNVTARSEGVTRARIVVGSRTAEVRVVVDATKRGFPHFSRAGATLSEWQPESSLYVRSMFPLGPAEIAANPDLTPELVKAAGINAWESGAYDRPRSQTLDEWKKAWHAAHWGPCAVLAGQTKMPLVLIGDDIARFHYQLRDSITNPTSRSAIQHVFTVARDSGFVISVEMVDEVTFMWGGDPVPAKDWMTPSGPLDRHAFELLMGIIDAIAGRPPITWQVAGGATAAVAANWMGDERFSDYASLYWVKLRHPYPYASCLDQERLALDVSTVGWRPALRRGAPVTLMSSAMGPHYYELAEGTAFRAGTDELIAPGHRPVSSSAQIMYGAAMGMAGTRIYACDTETLKASRAASKPRHEHQTGADATRVGTDRWQALATACNLVGRLERYLLQPQVSAVNIGPAIVTGARRGRQGRILLAVNMSECPSSARVDLRPYQIPGRFGRYRLSGATLTFEEMKRKDVDACRFGPGEAIVWVFPEPGPRRTSRVGPGVRIASPPPDATVAGSIPVRIEVGPRARRIELRVDGESVTSFDGPRPFETDLDTSRLRPDVWHSLSAVCFDGAGNESEARIAFRPWEEQVSQPPTEALPMSLAPLEILA